MVAECDLYRQAGRLPLVVCDLGQLRFNENYGRPALVLVGLAEEGHAPRRSQTAPIGFGGPAPSVSITSPLPQRISVRQAMADASHIGIAPQPIDFGLRRPRFVRDLGRDDGRQPTVQAPLKPVRRLRRFIDRWSHRICQERSNAQWLDIRWCPGCFRSTSGLTPREDSSWRTSIVRAESCKSCPVEEAQRHAVEPTALEEREQPMRLSQQGMSRSTANLAEDLRDCRRRRRTVRLACPIGNCQRRKWCSSQR